MKLNKTFLLDDAKKAPSTNGIEKVWFNERIGMNLCVTHFAGINKILFNSNMLCDAEYWSFSE